MPLFIDKKQLTKHKLILGKILLPNNMGYGTVHDTKLKAKERKYVHIYTLYFILQILYKVIV